MKIPIIAFIIMLLVVLLWTWEHVQRSAECKGRGGIYLKTFEGYKCLSAPEK